MSRFLKNIKVFSLWLAGLVIVVHLFIPHDHHSDSSLAGNDSNCASHQGETEHRSGYPEHCHALNDLTIEKNRTTVVANQHILSFDNIAFEISNPVKFNSIHSEHQFCDFQKSLVNIDFLKLSLLRAPPAST